MPENGREVSTRHGHVIIIRKVAMVGSNIVTNAAFYGGARLCTHVSPDQLTLMADTMIEETFVEAAKQGRVEYFRPAPADNALSAKVIDLRGVEPWHDQLVGCSLPAMVSVLLGSAIGSYLLETRPFEDTITVSQFEEITEHVASVLIGGIVLKPFLRVGEAMKFCLKPSG